VYRAHRTWANHEPVIGAEGVLQVADGARSLLVERLVRLPRAARPEAEASSIESLFPAPSSHDYH
ncbi:MAG TPA: hypothetical protein VMV23_04780, partial [Candidatus Nanopelagicaceae bacterium]|nr:hypothetical protein [Candidatus Nanopelagicaceae bacterium]